MKLIDISIIGSLFQRIEMAAEGHRDRGFSRFYEGSVKIEAHKADPQRPLQSGLDGDRECH
jgi:hypothetical protein